MYTSAVITELFAALLCGVMFLFTDWSVAIGLSVGVPLVGLFALYTYPFAMSFWVAVEYWTDLHNGEAGLILLKSSDKLAGQVRDYPTISVADLFPEAAVTSPLHQL